ncbi:cupin domain-containing protein [Cellulosimicrobium funkei]|uniref:cupin domain-containing protein n=1 Tax=Cellulosimicrobium funkei TaxID=264251 RepID=UPI0030FAE7B4
MLTTEGPGLGGIDAGLTDEARVNFFVCHHHDDQDEAFRVVDGARLIDLEDGAVDLASGELVVVPRGVERRPVALPTAQVVLFESATTLNTGSAADTTEGRQRTVRDLDRLDT